MPRREALRRFREILDARGVRPALRFLNGLGPHRFTAVFRFEGGTLRNLHMVDSEDPSVERCPDQPVLESYCIYVRQTARTFLTADSTRDGRVEGHPKQQTVQSYCGIPLLDEDGTLFGTICHFDFEPIEFTEEEVFLLEDAGPLIVRAVRATEWRPERRKAAGGVG
ncbi:MAG TPA: GAF domain-containing protein [Longimicrobiaceae bacterium]|nr:GAF domain-containing protein [Longimicrobiaceae bacterium]